MRTTGERGAEADAQAGVDVCGDRGSKRHGALTLLPCRALSQRRWRCLGLWDGLVTATPHAVCALTMQSVVPM
jgi:hypothetical protein